VTDTGAEESATHERDALISEMRAHNETLRQQLEAERQAHAEGRGQLAAALERIPALETPGDPETPSEPVRATEEGYRGGLPRRHRGTADGPRARPVVAANVGRIAPVRCIVLNTTSCSSA
jgi:hypothetical protein